MNFVIDEILVCMKLDLNNEIEIIDYNKFVVKLENGNKIEVSSYKLA